MYTKIIWERLKLKKIQIYFKKMSKTDEAGYTPVIITTVYFQAGWELFPAGGEYTVEIETFLY